MNSGNADGFGGGQRIPDALYTVASSAGAYEHLQGRCDTWAPDRVAAAEAARAAPSIIAAARINRDFLLRSVRHSLGLGAGQFLDLGCGYPGSDNVYDLTRRTIGERAPIVYVDHDPRVWAHARCTLEDGPGAVAVDADILAMEQLLADRIVRSAFDMTQPVAVLLHDVLPWCPDDGAVHQALGVLRAWMPPGSTLSLTHLTGHWEPDAMEAAAAVYTRHGLGCRPRSEREIAELFGDFVQQGTGLTAVSHWPEDGPYRTAPGARSAAFAGVAVKPPVPDREPA
ncbi:SAM-dependent methyltransferase [Streptomyces sp. NPDC057910]|uniref:SAM-dependent methyltransferase n=1 Tax=Streptomyces sp. NPDC057910 TaxID=3346278 RepID=UPI0036E1FC6E